MRKTLALTVVATLLLLSYSLSYGASKPTLKFLISGLDKQESALKNANARLTIEARSIEPLTTSKIKQLYRAGDKVVLESLKPYGCFKAKVTHESLMHQGTKWTASYSINAGQPLRITAIELSATGPGKHNKRINHALHRKHIIKVGQRFDVPAYQSTKNHLLSAAEASGYIRAKITTDKILIDLKAYTCVIKITLSTGPRFYFGNTLFSKNPLSTKFLTRYLKYKPGEPFSSAKLLNLQTNLTNSGYFKNVDIVPMDNKADRNRHIPVKVNLVKSKRKSYKLGVGYGTASGARISGGIDWRWVNSYGHKFKTNFNLSQQEQQLSAQYIIPGKDPSTDQYSINAAIYTLVPDKGKSFVKKVGLSHIIQRGKWTQTLSLSYLLEQYKFQDHDPYQNAQMLLPQASWTWLSTDKLIGIQHGTKASFQVSGSYKGLGSDVSFLQGEFNVKTVQTIWKDNRFILRGDLGYTIGKDWQKLPLSQQFYTGGPMSVRGYASLSIGPGRYLTVASAEYQRRVVGNWFGAVFYDAGAAFNDFNNWGSQLEKSTGIGVVWQSPIGNVSLYLAKALSARGRPIRLEFSIGPEL